MDGAIASILMLDGVTNGAIYALLALALLLVFAVTRVIFIPQGEFVAFGALTLVMTNKDGDTVARIQKGQTLDIRGYCQGFDDVVRMDRCDQIK